MQCTPEEKEARRVAQQEAQKKLEEQRAIEKEQRLKELEEEKTRAMLKAASSKK